MSLGNTERFNMCNSIHKNPYKLYEYFSNVNLVNLYTYFDFYVIEKVFYGGKNIFELNFFFSI